MPELPEVEVVRRGLADHVLDTTVAGVEVCHPRPVRAQPGGAAEFVDRLLGRTLLDAVRRGKFLWLPLSDGQALLVHLGMSGQLLLPAAGAPAGPHLRVRLRLAGPGGGAGELRFVDQRMFGGTTVVDLVPSPDGLPGGTGARQVAPLLPPQVAHIGRDPLDVHFDDARFLERLASRRTAVKRVLLDQTLASGIGNIYADEALWIARVHGEQPAATVSRPAARRLLAAVREVMTAALDQGGTSFDRLYVNVNGASGYFDRSLAVYGRTGLPCRRCGTPIRRAPFTNRSSFSCPRCQPLRRDRGDRARG